ncbi:hypothetical protein CRUP_029592 [Coryphaenoides rupestris]|nr:hypothetical protein CRUP_029592 [Coryphaenoides rupestris]
MVAIEAGSLAPLIRLRNLDISHNRLVDFPWEDLRNLRALQMLKMNHNELVMLPKDAFASLKYLKSLCLDHNKLITGTQRISTHASKCGLTSNTKYVSNHGFNGSLEDVKQYTFDFGVIALSVSETEARVRLNPLLTSKDYAGTAGTADATATAGGGDTHLEGLYLCLSSDLEHLAVQRSGVQRGVNTYVFRDLRPGTNYSLCLTYTGQDCDVQVLFTTRRAAPNLLVIVSVCIGLLTVSTVPLLGATCYHLVYKYRGKTYQLILKTRDRYQAERDLGAHFHLHATYPSESRRKINSSELEEEEEGRGKSGRQGEEEGSQGTESFAVSGDDCEACSEYSDRLPLGAEAINITSNYKYP